MLTLPEGTATSAAASRSQESPLLFWPAIAAVLAAVSYLVARYIGLGPETGPWAYWPINGLLCGLLFRRPTREWLAIGAAAVVAQAGTIFLVRGDLADGATVVGAIAGLAQASLAAWLLRAMGASRGPLSRPRDLGWFVVVAVCLIPLLITPLSAMAFARGLDLQLMTAWRPLFVGNSLSMLLFAPLMMQRWAKARADRRRWRAGTFEVVANQLIIVLLVMIVFGGPALWYRYVALPYAMFPLLVWTALRCGPSWTSVAIVSASTLAAWFTARQSGPFVISGSTQAEQVLHLQTYLAFLALTALLLSALAEQLRAAIEDTVLQNSIRQALLDSSGALVDLRDTDGRFLLVNSRMEELHGLEPGRAIGRLASEVIAPDAWATTVAHDRRVLERGVPLTFDESLVVNGATRHFVTTRFPVRAFDGTVRYVGAIAREDTVERELGERLQRVQRVEVLGQLAAGLAHDLNNLFIIVVNNVDMLRERVHPEAEREMLQEVHDASSRAMGLTSRLLALGRARAPTPVPVDVDALLVTLEPMLQLLVRGGIDLRLDMGSNGAMVMADPIGVEQVLLNLVSNARDAIHGEGRIEIRTRLVRDDAWLRVEVSDSGSGIDPSTRARLFEPFFTTKSETKGTGLGLYTTSLLVRQAGGTVDATSEPGGGTTFVVELPVRTP